MKIEKCFIFLFIILTAVFVSLVYALPIGRSVMYTHDDMSVNENMTYVYTPGILLHEGTIRVRVFYASDVKVRMDLYGNANDNFIEELPPSIYGNTFESEYYLSKDSQGTKLRFEVPEGAVLYISEVEVSSDRKLNSDLYLFAVLASAAISCLYCFISKKMYRGISPEQAAAFVIMTAALVFAFSTHFSDRLYSGTDLGGQLIRIEGIKDGILDGQFPVVLFPRTLNEYGELGAMYPYLFLIIPAILRIANVSMVAVYSLTILSISIAVLSVMYYCLRTLGISRMISSIASAVYLLSPAFIHAETDGGSALGTGFAYIFIPLVFVGFYHVFRGDRRKWVMLTIGFTGLLQSHLVTTLLVMASSVLIVAALIVDALIRKEKIRECISDICKAALWCIPINIWWLAIFGYYYINGNLYIGALGDGFLAGFDLPTFMAMQTTRYSIIFICITFLCMLLSFVKKNARFVFFFATMLLLGVFWLSACTRLFPWEILTKIPPVKFFINTMQMPDRFYTVISTCVSIAFAIAAEAFVSAVYKNKGKKTIYAGIVLTVFAIAAFCNIGNMRQYTGPDNGFITGITGDLAPYKQREYLPYNTVDEFFDGRNMYTVSNEKLIIDEYEKRGDRVKLGYHYEENIDDVYLELPMFYYPGYEVLLEDGTMLRAGLGEYNHMRIYPPYSEAESEINIRFRVSIVYGFQAIFSAVSFLVFIGLAVKKQPAK